MLLSVSELIGRLHPLIVHLPIGILFIALLLQWLSQKEGYAISHAVLKLLWALGVVSAFIACITGYVLSGQDAYEDTLVALHMWCGIGVAAVSLFLFAKVARRQYDAAYKTGAVALVLLIAATGHFGGSLTHGSDYLTAALYGEAKEDSVVIKPIPNVQEAQVYADIVQPILQAKCYSCHGAKKQKGKLRLDDSVRLLKGGEDGPVLIAGKAAESEMIKSLLLPRNDKKHMPPKDKPQLTANQVVLVHWWIDQGASFSKQVKSLSQPEPLKPVLAALEHAEVKKSTLALMLDAPVEQADAKAIAALQKRGVLVLPVAQNSHYLMVNFATAPSITNADVSLLLPLKKQLVQLKLTATKISDSALQVVAQCTNLYSLWLDHTAITDKGLGALQSLKNLQTLNLVGTNSTAAGVLQLQNLPQLKAIYLYKTKVPAAGWPALRNAFPHTLLDTGGYKVPTLATDTTTVAKAKN